MTYTQALTAMSRGRRVRRGEVVLFLRRGSRNNPQATIWREIPDGEPVLYEFTDEDRAATDWELVT